MLGLDSAAINAKHFNKFLKEVLKLSKEGFEISSTENGKYFFEAQIIFLKQLLNGVKVEHIWNLNKEPLNIYKDKLNTRLAYERELGFRDSFWERFLNFYLGRKVFESYINPDLEYDLVYMDSELRELMTIIKKIVDDNGTNIDESFNFFNWILCWN